MEKTDNRKKNTLVPRNGIIVFGYFLALIIGVLIIYILVSQQLETKKILVSTLFIDEFLLIVLMSLHPGKKITNTKIARRTRPEYSPGPACLKVTLIIVIILLPITGALFDRINELEEINSNLNNSQNATFGDFNPIVKKFYSMWQANSISEEQYIHSISVLFGYNQLLIKYSKLPAEWKISRDLNYIASVLKYYNDQNIFSSQRIHNIICIMEKNLEYFQTQKTKSDPTLLTFPSSNLTWLYMPDRGIQFQPVSTLNTLMDLYNSKQYTRFLNGLNELIEYKVDMHIENKSYTVWEYNYHINQMYKSQGIDSPQMWISGMAEGLATQALGYAYKLTNNTEYLNLSKTVMETFYINWTKGGVTDFHPGHDGWWYLEYGYTNKMRVLNGFMVTLVSLHEYYNITKNSNAIFLFGKGINELKVHLKDYDVGNWSAYSLVTRRASDWYHNFHIQLLGKLYSYTNEPVLKYYADLFQEYQDDAKK